jgi:hypothetical protein
MFKNTEFFEKIHSYFRFQIRKNLIPGRTLFQNFVSSILISLQRKDNQIPNRSMTKTVVFQNNFISFSTVQVVLRVHEMYYLFLKHGLKSK